MQTSKLSLFRPIRPAPQRIAAPVRRAPAHRCMVRAAMAGAAGGEDPYQVLGIPKNADYNAIQRAYKRKMSENITNDEAKSRIEAAHSSLMMSALTSRLQGNAAVDKDVLYADRARFFPWRPRLFLAERNMIVYTGVAQAMLLAWALLSPLTAGTQPVMWSALVGAVSSVMKQNQINPPPQRGMEMTDEEKNQTGKNILRGAFMAFMATFAGCFLLYTAPDAIAAQMGKVMPLWFYEGQSMILTIGCCTFNWIFTSFFR